MSIAAYSSWFYLAVLLAMIALLVIDRVRPALVFLGGITVLTLFGLLPLEVFFESISNQQILTICLIISLSVIVQQNFPLQAMLNGLLGRSRSGKSLLLKSSFFVAGLSSVFNNTPVVLMLMPWVYGKAKALGTEPSRLLMPLSFAAILGGMLTVIGTSTNLMLNGLLSIQNEPLLTNWDFLSLGLIVTLAGIFYLYFFGYNLLESTQTLKEDIEENSREYFLEVALTPGSVYTGQDVSQTGLRELRGVSLLEVIRGTHNYNVITSSSLVLEQGDRLVFSGKVSHILDFVKKHNRDLVLPEQGSFSFQQQLRVLEIILPANHALEGVKIKDSDFRKEFESSILAIHRKGEKHTGRLGEIRLRKGDLLLLAVSDSASSSHLSDNFYILSEQSSQKFHPKSWTQKTFVLGTCLLLLLPLTGLNNIFVSLLGIITLALCLNLVTLQQLHKSVEIDWVLILVCAVALGKTFISSGAAGMVSGWILSVFMPLGQAGLLVVLFLFTVLLTSFVTNVAAVSVAFPLAYTISQSLGVAGEPFYLGIAFAASAAFMTPFGYQTNLIVAGPGGYRMKDFLRVGAPLTLIYGLCCLIFIILNYQLL